MKTSKKILSEDTASERKNYVKRVTAIAKEYGFDVEIGESFTSWGRIDEKENKAYFSGGPKRKTYLEEMNKKEQEKYESKYGLVCGEYDRFEDEEHCHSYFKHMREDFLKAYPEFNK